MSSDEERESTHHVTRVLRAAARGETGAAEELLPLVYDELKVLARARMRQLEPGQTLQSTALVHDAWLRVGAGAAGFENRVHFYGAAARAMRNILVDQARRRARLKRGGDREREGGVEDIATPTAAPVEDLLTLDHALKAFEVEYARQAQVVMLRYFAGLELPEVAGLLNVSSRTVDRDWRFARTWLRRAVGG